MSERQAARATGDPHGAAVALKASFTDIYDDPDPRRYFRVLGDLGYAELGHMHRIAEMLLAQLTGPGKPGRVLDLCCSYGMLGMLLRTDLTADDLAAAYREPAVAQWTTEQLAARDRDLLARHRSSDPPRVYGLDVATSAVTYGQATGALETGFAEDLETTAPSRRLRAVVGTVDLITVAGGIGYVTERTFERLLRHTTEPRPWVAALVSRVYPYDRIASSLARWGLVTERLTHRTFARRQFADAAEQQATLAHLARLGVDATGREAEGWYHAELHLSRPASQTDPSVERLFGG